LIYDADDKRVANILFEFGVDENTKGHDMPIAKDNDAEGGDNDEELEVHEAKKHRMLTATVNYLTSDRLGLQLTASVLGMTRPTVQSWQTSKRRRGT
jgi:hypothetical protein